ncbi:MAG: hypothetical protein ABW110_22355 [Steroidobacteraceae bacterium]
MTDAKTAAEITSLTPVLELLQAADQVFDEIGYPDASWRPLYHRHVLMLLSQAYLQIFATRVEQPDWVPHTGPLFPWGAANHDTIYQFAPLDANGVYRVAGKKGSEIIASLMFRRGGPNTGEVHGAPLGEIDVQALSCGPDGKFSVVLSKEKPRECPGEWFAIPPLTTGLVARHVTVEPTDVDGVWSIERLDRCGPPAIQDDVAERMRLMSSFVNRLNRLVITWLKKQRDESGVNRFVPERFQGHGGIALQLYYQAVFELEADEALILESELPESVLYWSVQLFDPFYNAIDFVLHASARNFRQAHIDTDGKARFVIAKEDPGVANWLDPAGYLRGGVMWRWHTASSFPEPTLKRVKLAQLADHLPADVHRVDTAQRRAERATRIAQYQSRRRC